MVWAISSFFKLFYTLETGVFYMAGRCTCGLGIIIKSFFNVFQLFYTLEAGVFYMAGRCTCGLGIIIKSFFLMFFNYFIH